MSSTLRGIDIASFQSTLDISKVKLDFVIIKATEGTNYVNPSCDRHYQQAIRGGKLRGIYHFARPSKNSAKAEAQFFVKNIKGYIGDAILFLDWEDPGHTSNVSWAKTWLDEVYRLTGVRPAIYMSESVVNRYNWSPVAKANYGLWVAKYRDYVRDYNYNMAQAGAAPKVKWWSFYMAWQWTSAGRLTGYSGNLDTDIFYGTAATWKAYAMTASAKALAAQKAAQAKAAKEAAAKAAQEAKARAEAAKKAAEEAKAAQEAKQKEAQTVQENAAKLDKILQLVQWLVDKISAIFK